MGGGGDARSQPMSTAVHRSPNKLWRSNSIYSLCPIYLSFLGCPAGGTDKDQCASCMSICPLCPTEETDILCREIYVFGQFCICPCNGTAVSVNRPSLQMLLIS